MSFNRGDFLPPTVSRRWGTLTKQIIVIGGLIATIWLFFRFSALLPVVVLAGLLAYIITPIVNWVHRLTHIPRTLVILLIYILVLVLISLAPALVLPGLVKQLSELELDLERIIVSAIRDLSEIEIVVLGYSIQLPVVIPQFAGTLQGMLSPFATGAFSVVIGIASSVGWLFFILVLSFYLVRDSAKISRYLKGLLPPEYRAEFEELGRRIGWVWNAFFRGQIILGLAVGVTTGVTVSALGLRNGLILGVLAGVLEIIPYFGPILAAIPAILLALFQGSTYLPVSNLWFAVIIIGAYLVIQQVENLYLVPRILGGSVRLHPVVVLVGILAGGILAGILGILLAAPVIATLRILVSYCYRKILDLEPFGDAMVPVAERIVPQGGMIAGYDIEAVLFDLDGTLLDPDYLVVDSIAARLEGIEPLFPSRDARRVARRTIMATEKPANALMNLVDKIGDKIGKGDRQQSVQDSLARVQAQPPTERFKLVEGVPELLEYLDGRFRLGLVTTRLRVEADAFLNHFDYGDKFQVVISREDVDHLKPAPDAILLATEKLGVSPQRCVAVGDTKADIEAANQAGAVSLGVLSGLGARQDLEEAELILENITDLRAWL